MTIRLVRRSITVLSAAAATGLLPACSTVPATRALRVEAQSAGTILPQGPLISMTSEDTSVTVNAWDDDGIASSLRSVGAKIAVDRVRGVGQLRFQAHGTNARIGAPLIVIDGVPLDEAFEVRIAASKVARVDVMRDTLATRPYGPRGRDGVVLVTLRPH